MDDVQRMREDEWFLQNEKKLLEAAREARQKREQERASHEEEEQRRRLREQHYMKCPKCGHDLRPETLEGIEIDRCTYCEGFYIDAGELEQLYLQREQAQRHSFIRRLLGI